MAKINKGTSFSDRINYGLDNNKNAKMIAIEGVFGIDKESMAESFEMQASMNSRVAKKVGLISLNFSKDDPKLSDETMAEIAREYLEKMDIVDTQFIVVRHNDKDHQHCHIVFNRINNLGKTISDSKERYRNEKVCKELTKKYGLKMSEGKGNVKREQLRGKDKVRYEIYDALSEYVPQSNGWTDLTLNLLTQDIDIEFRNCENTDKAEGVSFSKDGYSFSGSKIDKQFGFGKLDKIFSQKFEQAFFENLKSMDDGFNVVGAAKDHLSALPEITTITSDLSKPRNQFSTDWDELKRRLKKKKPTVYRMSN